MLRSKLEELRQQASCLSDAIVCPGCKREFDRHGFGPHLVHCPRARELVVGRCAETAEITPDASRLPSAETHAELFEGPRGRELSRSHLTADSQLNTPRSLQFVADSSQDASRGSLGS